MFAKKRAAGVTGPIGVSIKLRPDLGSRIGHRACAGRHASDTSDSHYCLRP
jgi:hypothetical protein